MSMEYFEGGEEYGWEDELAASLPPDSIYPVDSTTYIGDGSIARLVTTEAISDAFRTLLTERSAMYNAYFDSVGGYAGNYYTDYQPGVAVSATYAGITRNNETPAWRMPIG